MAFRENCLEMALPMRRNAAEAPQLTDSVTVSTAAALKTPGKDVNSSAYCNQTTNT